MSQKFLLILQGYISGTAGPEDMALAPNWGSHSEVFARYFKNRFAQFFADVLFVLFVPLQSVDYEVNVLLMSSLFLCSLIKIMLIAHITPEIIQIKAARPFQL
jgi:hypothetical protein